MSFDISNLTSSFNETITNIFNSFKTKNSTKNSTKNNSSSAIDEKKSSSNTETTPDYGNFMVNVIKTIIYVLIMCFVSFLFMYNCKIAETHILPDSLSFEPFGPDERIFKQEAIIDTNIVKIYDKGFLKNYGLSWLFGEDPTIYSTKVKFNKNTFSLDLLNYLKKIVVGEKSQQLAFIALYFYEILSSCISTNFFMFNKVFGFLNSNVSESFLLIFFMFFGHISFSVIFIINFCLSFVYFILNIPNLFKVKYPNQEWCYDSKTWLRIFTLNNIAAFFIFIFFFPLVFIVSFIVTFYSFISPLFISGKIQVKDQNNEYKDGKEYNFLTFLKSTINYKSQVLIILLVLYLVNDIVIYLGSNYLTAFIIAVIILLYFTNIFQSYNITDEEKNKITKLGNEKTQKPNIEINANNSNAIKFCKSQIPKSIKEYNKPIINVSKETTQTKAIKNKIIP